MDYPLISVIVPIYMIDRYIGICIESIINQTYQNLEIILVDDGSRDRCSEICDLYAKKDKRIRVIHKLNGGLVSARKAGIHQSNGEYVSYVDGDDWIEPGFIDALYMEAVKTGAEIVCAGQTRDLFSRSVRLSNNCSPEVYEGKGLSNLWKNMISTGPYYRPGVSTYLWNKLFKREVILSPQSTVDNRISIGEDAAVVYPALLKSKTVSVIENYEYHYRQREDSMLKQSGGYAEEAEKLQYLLSYLQRWSLTTDMSLNISSQIVDYVLSIAIMRSGGRLPQDNFSIFGNVYYGKRVVIYSAGTFGQQLIKRFKETKHCDVVAWIDDDYWEYRRCCLDVDPVENIKSIEYDYVLIATVDSMLGKEITERLVGLGVQKEKVLTILEPIDKDILLHRFLDVETIKRIEEKKSKVISHA